MKIESKRPMALLCSLLLVFSSLFASVSQAEVIGTQEVLGAEQLEQQRSELKALLDREEVQEQLAAMGVERDYLEERIGAMTEEELAQVSEAMDHLPAGAGHGTVLGVLLVVFIVFVVTDVIGATNIFPFINPVN